MSAPAFETSKLKLGNSKEISKGEERLLLACPPPPGSGLSDHLKVGAGL